MSHNIHTKNPLDAEIDAVELAGLALALRIVVSDYLSDPRPSKHNALDALSDVVLSRADAHAKIASDVGECNYA